MSQFNFIYTEEHLSHREKAVYIKDGLRRWPSDTHPAQSSFGKLSRNDTVDLYSLSSHRLKQWGQLGEILGGVRFPEGGASHWSV